jgi:hypothetical protein
MRFLKRMWIWFDDLTGISAAMTPLLEHPVPKARKSAWLYVEFDRPAWPTSII